LSHVSGFPIHYDPPGAGSVRAVPGEPGAAEGVPALLSLHALALRPPTFASAALAHQRPQPVAGAAAAAPAPAHGRFPPRHSGDGGGREVREPAGFPGMLRKCAPQLIAV
jgi:hypothetical protein